MLPRDLQLVNFRVVYSYFPVLLMLLLFVAFNAGAQPPLTIQKKGLTNIVSLQADGRTVSNTPSSMPDNIANNGNSVIENSPGDVRDLNWELKFSQAGKVFRDVSFANAEVGYIVTELGTVYKSIDGGDSWTSVLNLGFPYYWYGVYALSPDTVIISGFNNQGNIDEGVIRWTYNGGNTWSGDIVLTLPVFVVGWLERVHFFNADTGIVVNSFSGGCWFTTTGGKNVSSWTYETINSDLAWTAGNIDAQSSGQVYATGIHFANSNDYGANWTSTNSADSVFDGGVDFLDDNNLYGWTGGGQISAPVAGWVRSTKDGGITWSQRLNTFPYPIRALKFFDETSGLAVGGNLFEEEGGIYSTDDGGLTWNLDVNTAAEMFSIETKISSGDSTIAWCVGSTGGTTGFKGVLYKATTANVATGVHEIHSETQKDFELYQNVPNPFNTITEISFTIPFSCYASLKVYDILGKEIATLVDGDEQPGFKSLNLDATDLPDGIYYYQLKAGSFSETKKLLLQR